MNIDVKYDVNDHIPEKVVFSFIPENSDNPEIREVFKDDLAKIIWIAIKRNHLVSQHFNLNCLKLARILRRKKWKNISGSELNGLLHWLGMIGCEEYSVGDQVLPFIKGERKFEIEYKLEDDGNPNTH